MKKMKYVVLLLPVLLLSACQSVHYPAGHGIGGDSRPQAGVENRSVIWNARMTLEVEEVSPATELARAAVAKVEGYVESSSESKNKHGIRSNLTLRVPEDRIEESLNLFSAIGKVSYRQVYAQDVTGDVIDQGARLKNAMELRERLRAMLATTKDVEELLKIERKLAELQTEIDQIQGRQNVLVGKVRYATIHLVLEQPSIPGPITLAFKAIGWTLKKLFVIRA